MQNCAEQALVVAKIISQGATRDEEFDDEFSLWFTVKYRDQTFSFQIPTALVGSGYSQGQLEAIELELQKLGLELLPLDHNLIQ